MTKPRSRASSKPSRQVKSLLSTLTRQRANLHKRMIRYLNRGDEMTALVAGAMALAYTDAQVQLEKALGLSPRKTNTNADKRKKKR